MQPGSVTLEGYRAGLGIAPKPVQLPAGGLTGVVLDASTQLTAVTGSVNIVNAAGGLTTSVILAVASTFDPKTIRGLAPAGLRAGDVGGAFRIEGVPALVGGEGCTRDSRYEPAASATHATGDRS